MANLALRFESAEDVLGLLAKWDAKEGVFDLSGHPGLACLGPLRAYCVDGKAQALLGPRAVSEQMAALAGWGTNTQAGRADPGERAWVRVPDSLRQGAVARAHNRPELDLLCLGLEDALELASPRREGIPAARALLAVGLCLKEHKELLDPQKEDPLRRWRDLGEALRELGAPLGRWRVGEGSFEYELMSMNPSGAQECFQALGCVSERALAGFARLAQSSSTSHSFAAAAGLTDIFAPPLMRALGSALIDLSPPLAPDEQAALTQELRFNAEPTLRALADKLEAKALRSSLDEGLPRVSKAPRARGL